jgi:hypothetical protein
MTTSDDVDGDGDSKDNDANDNDGGNGDNNDGEVEHNGGDDNNNDDNNDDVYIDVVVEDDDNNGTMTMRWQRGQMDDNDQRCNGDGRPATRRTLASTMPPIRDNNQLMSTVWGGVDGREGQFQGGGTTEKGRGGGD